MSILEWQLERHKDPRMAYYRETYRNSLRQLSGKPPKGKRLIVYCEQGIGDTIQMLRYVPALLEHNEVTLHCAEPLHSLVKTQWPVSVLDKFNPELPDHDLHILSMDLPLLFPSFSSAPYIHIGGQVPEILAYSDAVGIAWEGNPSHPENQRRCCPLKHFQSLSKTLFCLQPHTYLEELQEGCESMELMGLTISNMLDVAQIINSVSHVVTVDTAAMHLAGSMGVSVYGLLSKSCDPRWGGKSTGTAWYPSIRFARQQEEGDWSSAFNQLHQML